LYTAYKIWALSALETSLLTSGLRAIAPLARSLGLTNIHMIAVDSNQAAHTRSETSSIESFTGTVGRKQFDLFQRRSLTQKIARSTLLANASLIDLLFVYAPAFGQ
jgi:hypothetical protein